MDHAECIRYASDVLYQLPDISSQKREHFLKMIARIKKRTEKTILHTALIGDFSTGKSTFINALLGQELLKMSWHATTAVPTMICHHDREGIRIQAETIDGEKYLLERQEQRMHLEQKLNARIPEGQKEAIAYLSTTNDFARQIKRIGIRVNASEKLRHICLIDTPGVNPGAEEAKFHVQKTQDVLRKYADATIILFQGMQVYSASFRKFLDEHAKLFLNDAAFVITMMDAVEESQRTELLDFVRLQMEQGFGIENPPVFGCCAKAALRKETAPPSQKLVPEERYWAKQFGKLREELLVYMGECREKVIRRQLIHLLETLVRELDEEVGQRALGLEQKKEALEENAVFSLAHSLGEEEYKRVYTAKYKEYLYDRQRLDVLATRCGQMHEKLLGYITDLKHV